MPIRFALFDMDDVLCAYRVERRLEALARHAGRPAAAIRAEIWESGFLEEADRGAWPADAFLAEFGRRLGRPIDRSTWVEARRIAMEPFDDVLALVAETARRMPVGILTNNDPLVSEEIDRLFPALRPLFADRILVSADLGLAKPDPACFDAACTRLGFEPAHTLFTDDLAVNVRGAEQAGLAGHVFTGAEGLRRALSSG